jgi:hypothetical protein
MGIFRASHLAAVATEEFRSAVDRDGWCLIAGVETTLADFEHFTRLFGVCTDTRIVHYPPDGSGLGFHAEDAYNPYRPDALWFLCLSERGADGAPTYLVDGQVIFSALSPSWQAFCRDNVLRYSRRWPAYVWQVGLDTSDRVGLEACLARLPGVSYSFLDNGDLSVGIDVPILTTSMDGTECFSNSMPQAVTEPTFYGPSLADGSPVPEELISKVNEIATNHEFPIRWETGHLAAIDNRRMMHRRGPYSGARRDLRARHGEDFFGSALPSADTAVATWTKSLLQGEEGYPVASGPAVLGLRR